MTTTRDDIIINRLATVNPFITAGEIKAQLPESCSGVSVDTIKRRLRKHFQSPIRRAAGKTLLTARMRSSVLPSVINTVIGQSNSGKRSCSVTKAHFKCFQHPNDLLGVQLVCVYITHGTHQQPSTTLLLSWCGGASATTDVVP